MKEKLAEIITWLENNAGELPTLADISDADMALMYLRHVAKHLEVS